jgi:hypothetical protein
VKVLPAQWRGAGPRVAADDWRDLAYGAFDFGGPLDRISARLNDADDLHPGGDALVLGGCVRLCDWLARGLDIVADAPVSSIDSSRSGTVLVRAGNRDYTARAIVVTLPLGVLKAGAVRFNPPLPPSHTEPVARLDIGSVLKVAMGHDAAFWPDDTQWFGAVTDRSGATPAFPDCSEPGAIPSSLHSSRSRRWFPGRATRPADWTRRSRSGDADGRSTNQRSDSAPRGQCPPSAQVHCQQLAE